MNIKNNIEDRLNLIINRLDKLDTYPLIYDNINTYIDNIEEEINNLQNIDDMKNNNISNEIIERINQYNIDRKFAKKFYPLFYYLYYCFNNNLII